MAVDYSEVMGLFGSLMGGHPQSMGLLMQSYSGWDGHTDDLTKIANEYQSAAVNATGAMDKGGIAMQLAAMHPWVADLLIQTLLQWQSRIPDLIEIIKEFQAASTAAMKT